MTTRLEQAWTEVSKLSPEEQDAFADKEQEHASC